MFTAIDLTHMQQEHEEARRRDSVALLGLLETVKRDDRAIIEVLRISTSLRTPCVLRSCRQHLQVQVQDMREAIMSVQKVCLLNVIKLVLIDHGHVQTASNEALKVASGSGISRARLACYDTTLWISGHIC